MGSLGALVSGLPQYLQESFGWQPVASYKPLFALTIIFSAYLMQSFSLNVPIFIGGLLQLFHDCVFYLLFRNVRPPEEEVARG